MKNSFFSYLCYLCLICQNVFIPQIQAAAEDVSSKPSLILSSREAGFFSIFFDVLSMLKNYEKGLYSSVQVDFDVKGYYYSPEHGPNWWEYYFEPITLGTLNEKDVLRDRKYINSREIKRNTTREYCNQLIATYIRIKPEIQSQVDSFVSDNFEGTFVIGIHYRGTDKKRESPRVPYEIVLTTLQSTIEKLNTNQFKIFIATDEAPFVEYIRSFYPDKICYNQNAFRSPNTDPVHLASSDPCKRGEEAIVDCVLLSKTNLLLRTSSNLSIASGYFNSEVTIIELEALPNSKF